MQENVHTSWLCVYVYRRPGAGPSAHPVLSLPAAKASGQLDLLEVLESAGAPTPGLVAQVTG
jgi:hypothetical protein